MSFPYPEYKESLVEWIGPIPSHWNIGFARRLFAERDDRSATGEEELMTVSHLTGVTPRSEKNVNMFEAETTEGYKLCEPGDLVINTLWAWMGAMGVSKHLGIVSPAYNVYQPGPALAASYVDAISRVPEFAQEARRYSKGVWASRLRLYPEEFFRLQLPVPPPAEQSAIAAFLDHETAKIDALVAEQERLIALLKEKRQAVISHAVTKGLDPSAPMKDSGVEWLGQVPAHWEVGALKRFWTVSDCKHVTAEFVDQGIPLASIREVQSRFVDLTDAKQTTNDFYELLIEDGRCPRPGDLIFSRNATVGEVAQVADWHPPFAMGQDVCLLRRHEDTASCDFMQAVIWSRVVVEQLAVVMVGSTFKRVNVEEIRNIVVPMPPASEQAEVAAFIGTEMGAFDTLITAATHAITLLRERRAALISAAVTGKIDVRGVIAVPAAEAA